MTIIADRFGDEWEVRRVRDGVHLSVSSGYRLGEKTGTGGVGPPRVILTEELALFLESRADDPIESLGLPLSRSTIKRLRSDLGIHRAERSREWWTSRLPELRSMTNEQFSEKYSLIKSVVTNARRRFGIPDGRRRSTDG